MCNEAKKHQRFDHQSKSQSQTYRETYSGHRQGLIQDSGVIQQAPDGAIPLGVVAASLLTWRNKADEIFEHKGFAASPAWDIVLGLFHAAAEGSALTLTDVANLSPCELATTARWVSVLEEMHMLKRVRPSDDSAEPIISIAENGWLKTEKALCLYL